MRKNPPGQEKKSRLRGYLCAAFAAAILCNVGASYALHRLDAPPRGEPATIRVLGETAAYTPLLPSLFDWQNMLRQQQHDMDNPKDARQYKNYLAQFDDLKGEPLDLMAFDVNAIVEANVKYSDKRYAMSFFYWSSPFQTETTRAGDCKAFAALQEAILLYLGVPQNRLFIAIVDQGNDLHGALLLNTAKAGQKQDFILLNDGGPVAGANAYMRPHGANASWPHPYKLYAVLNQEGLWMTNPLGIAVSLAGLLNKKFAPEAKAKSLAAALPARAQVSLKIA